MKKNILFLTLSMLTALPLTAANYSDYPYVLTEETTITIPYESDTKYEASFCLPGKTPTRNTEHIFRETKELITTSKTPQSAATRYYLSQQFQDLQERDGQYWSEAPVKYIHAINALRKDLHTQENIRRMVSALETREDVSQYQKITVTAIEKDMYAQTPGDSYRSRIFEKIKTIIKFFSSDPTTPTAAPAQAQASTSTVTEKKSPTRQKRKSSPLLEAVKKPFRLPDASERPKVSFKLKVTRNEFRATYDEIAAMHNDTVAMKALIAGKVTTEESTLEERMRRRSSIGLNDSTAAADEEAQDEFTQPRITE